MKNRNMRGLLIFQGLLLALSLTVAGWSSIAAPANPQLTKSLERLRASSDEWRREEAAYRQARKKGLLSQSEFEDYAEFVASLRLRLLKQCEETRVLGGDTAIRDFDCVRLRPSPQSTVVAIPGKHIRTEQEKRESLNAKLNALEGEIDESLLKRQQELKEASKNLSQRTPSASKSGTGVGAAGGANASKRNNAKGKDKQKGTGATSPREASSGLFSGKGDRRQAVGSPPSPSGPKEKQKFDRAAKWEKSTEGGSDDDVVARQLREAAEKETDPLLKEKLWEEYRKYKRTQK